MSRYVVYTNTIVSRMLMPKSVPALAMSKAVRSGVVLASEATFEELSEVLSRKKFDAYVSIEERQEFLRLFARIVETIEITRRIEACRDPKDDKFLELAVNGEADMIITGDQDLLVLNPFEKIPIIRPKEFLKQL